MFKKEIVKPDDRQNKTNDNSEEYAVGTVHRTSELRWGFIDENGKEIVPADLIESIFREDSKR